MSCRIAVVCEDHTLDQFLVVPIIEALMASIGKPRATVRVVTDPRLRGLGDVKKLACQILERYGTLANAVIFVIDGDGAVDRDSTFGELLKACERHNDKAVVVVAVQETEVWALWGVRDRLGVSWHEVRADSHPKERFFDPLVTREDRQAPGRGRARLVNLSLRSGFNSLASGCPELAQLAARVATIV